MCSESTEAESQVTDKRLVTPMNMNGVIKDSENLRRKELKSIYLSLECLRKSVPRTTKKIQCSFTSIMWMNWLGFVVGFGLAVSLIIQIISGEMSWYYLAAGGAGLITIIVSMLTKPQVRLQKSMADLTRLQVVIYGWFSHFINWDVYLSNVTMDDKTSEDVKQLIRESGDHILANTKALFRLIAAIEQNEESPDF